MKVKDYLTRERWVKGHYVFREDGIEKCCLYRAINLCYSNLSYEWRGAIERVESAVREMGYGTIEAYNDSPYTTYRDVKELVEKLDV